MTELRIYLSLAVPLAQIDMHQAYKGNPIQTADNVDKKRLMNEIEILLSTPAKQWPEGMAHRVAEEIAKIRTYYQSFGSGIGI